MSTSADPQILLDAREISRALTRMASGIRDYADGLEDLVMVGIQRRGVELADRLVAQLEAETGIAVPRGALDITLYRDDFGTVGPMPVVGTTDLPMELTERRLMIVDDVLYTGRTVRAALNELYDFGRPARVGLCVLVDRGGRELPIQADVVGAVVEADAADRVDVLLTEVDGVDLVQKVRRTSS